MSTPPASPSPNVSPDPGQEKEKIFLDATVLHALGSSALRAVLANGHEVVAICSRSVVAREGLPEPGRTVRMEFSPYDMSKGRVLF
jgi:translation initiation factor IF-1